jgi:diguanylate cyclase (GGDEF)-like protein
VALLVMIGGLAAKLGAQIARSKRAEEDLSRLALIDGLTGLANRRRFDELFEREWRRAERERTSLAVLMIDVDSFKSYNDVYGHSRGDAALIAIARAIAANAREPSDVAARYGGEEFVVVLPGTDAHAAVTVAERIRSAVVRLAIPHADARNGVGSVSIGVASIVPSGATSPAALIDAADRALYDAKRTGRDRVALIGDASAQGPGPAIRA